MTDPTPETFATENTTTATELSLGPDDIRPNTETFDDQIPAGLVIAQRDDVSVDVHDFERYQFRPVRSRGTVKALTAEGFITAYKRRADADEHEATIYADPDRCALVAVLNDDHWDQGAGWRDHRIELALQDTPEWHHWTKRQGLHSQAFFAETIDAGQDEIVRTPNATVMLEIAQRFEASIGGKFRQSGRLDDGSVQFAYEETVEAKVGEGLIPVPKSFFVRLRPFWGASPRDIEARIRYTCRGGELAIGYVLHKHDEIRREAFSVDVLGLLAAELPAATVIEGTPAEPTPPGRVR